MNNMYVNYAGRKLTYYEFFGVDEKASKEELKKAFRAMAMKYHPDKNSDKETAETNFKVVNTVWQVLSDAQKRNDYDYQLAVDRGQIIKQQEGIFVSWHFGGGTASSSGGYSYT